MNEIKQFEKICQEAIIEYERKSYNRPDLDKYGIQLLDLISQNHELKYDFEKAFIKLFQNYQKEAWELIPFCMHTLRWQSLEDFFTISLQQAKTARDFRTMPILDQILDSFNDNWEDIDLHPYYG
jgi:hypothetical protein